MKLQVRGIGEILYSMYYILVTNEAKNMIKTVEYVIYNLMIVGITPKNFILIDSEEFWQYW